MNEKYFKHLNEDDYKGESWMPIKEYEGMYEISNIGRVRSLPRCAISDESNRKRNLSFRFMKLGDNGQYVRIWLNKKASKATVVVHKLVANAFIANPNNKPCVNHKNGIKFDNRVCNLEWVTYSENQKHAIATGLAPKPHLGHGENHPTAKLSNLAVTAIRILGSTQMPARDISEIFCLHKKYVRKIITNKVRKAG